MGVLFGSKERKLKSNHEANVKHYSLKLIWPAGGNRSSFVMQGSERDTASICSTRTLAISPRNTHLSHHIPSFVLPPFDGQRVGVDARFWVYCRSIVPSMGTHARLFATGTASTSSTMTLQMDPRPTQPLQHMCLLDFCLPDCEMICVDACRVGLLVSRPATEAASVHIIPRSFPLHKQPWPRESTPSLHVLREHF